MELLHLEEGPEIRHLIEMRLMSAYSEHGSKHHAAVAPGSECSLR
jgi:hypothetical protein